MRFELFVALRYLFARRKQAFIYIISTMSVLGVAIGVASLVVVLGVYNGFTTDIRDRILGANAHIIITGPLAALAPASVTQGSPLESSGNSGTSGMLSTSEKADAQHIGLDATLKRIESTPGVVGAMPFLYAEGMLSSARGVKGVVLRGIDPENASEVLSILNDLQSGSVKDLEPSVPGAPPGVLVGKELADRLGLETGSRVNLLSPAGQKTAAGFQPQIGRAHV